jgi:hypothetical protein
MTLSKTHALVLSVAILGAACNAGQQKDSLRDIVEYFHANLCWQRYGEVASNLPARNRQKFLDNARKLQDEVAVADYEVVQVAAHEGSKILVRAVFDWESKGTGTVHKTELAELWQKVGSQWLMVDSKVLNGQQIPLLVDARAE